MSKNRYSMRTVDIKGKTLCEQFQNWIKDHRKISDIIAFLHVENARWLTIPVEKMTDEQREDVTTFVEQFLDEYGSVTARAIDEEFYDEPYLFRLADEIDWYNLMQEYHSEYERLSAFRRKEADSLADTLFERRKDKEITVVTSDDAETYNFAGTIPRTELDRTRQELRNIMGHAVQGEAGICVREHTKKGNDIYGIRIEQTGFWHPMDADTMRHASLTTASGVELEPEDGETYTAITREKF